MERETKELTTSFGSKYVIKTYFLAKEVHAYETAPQSAMTVKARMSDDGSTIEPDFGEIDMPAMTKALEYKLIELGIIEFNGDKKDILDVVLNRPIKEYNEIVSSLQFLVNDPN